MGGMQSPKPKLSRNTSTFRELRVTEEDEENLDDTIMAETPRKARSVATEHGREVHSVETSSNNPSPDEDTEAEPFVLPTSGPEQDDVDAVLPDEVAKEEPMKQEATSIDGATTEDETGNDSGIASSSPSDEHTALGLSIPSTMPFEREPWQRILWKRQEGYDDDYVPESFLAEERQKLQG